MNDWVLLGCGYIATRLARELLAAGDAVRICTLNPDKHAELAALGAHLVKLDAGKMRAFGPALYRARQPVVLYGIPPVKNMPAGEPMRRATEAALGVGAQRFIYLGSTAIYGQTTDGEVVDESSSIALFDPDAAPLVADEGALEASRMGGLQTVVLRLTAVYGPGRGTIHA